jgi:phosphotransacetylase
MELAAQRDIRTSVNDSSWPESASGNAIELAHALGKAQPKVAILSAGASNMLAKSLSFLADADSAGIVLGAGGPIILTSRADSMMSRLASCAVSVLVSKARREVFAQAIG